MMNYTKGEWKLERGEFNVERDEGNQLCIGSITAGDEGWFVARIENAAECEANAQLIALSPKMAELLKQLADWNAGKFGKESNTKIIEISKLASKIIAEMGEK